MEAAEDVTKRLALGLKATRAFADGNVVNACEPVP
jgi:hypothetical protein